MHCLSVDTCIPCFPPPGGLLACVYISCRSCPPPHRMSSSPSLNYPPPFSFRSPPGPIGLGNYLLSTLYFPLPLPLPQFSFFFLLLLYSCVLPRCCPLFNFTLSSHFRQLSHHFPRSWLLPPFFLWSRHSSLRAAPSSSCFTLLVTISHPRFFQPLGERARLCRYPPIYAWQESS